MSGKAESSLVPIPGYVYMLVEREFIRAREQVCKIGRSKDVSKRFRQYPKGSKLLIATFTKDHFEAELELISLFIKTFKQRADIGREYFEGPLLRMMASFNHHMNFRALNDPELNTIFEIPRESHEVDDEDESIRSVIKSVIDRAVQCDRIEIPEKREDVVEKDRAIIEFMNEQGPFTSEPSSELYTRFLDFVVQKGWRVSLGHEKFSRSICSIYGAKSDVVRDENGPRRYLNFMIPERVIVDVRTNPPFEHLFLKDFAVEHLKKSKNEDESKPLSIRMDVLFEHYKRWETRESHQLSVNSTKLGMKISRLIWSKTGNRLGFKGIFKSRNTAGSVYTFDMNLLAREMVEKQWLDSTSLDM